MSLRALLRDFVKVVSDEAERNPGFAERLEAIFDSSLKRPTKKSSLSRRSDSTSTRPSNRRPPALLDPVALATQGEGVLRDHLTELNLEQLKDIVAEYGMDPQHLAMKWRNPERIIDRIVEVSVSRAHKGDAFR